MGSCISSTTGSFRKSSHYHTSNGSLPVNSIAVQCSPIDPLSTEEQLTNHTQPQIQYAHTPNKSPPSSPNSKSTLTTATLCQYDSNTQSNSNSQLNIRSNSNSQLHIRSNSNRQLNAQYDSNPQPNTQYDSNPQPNVQQFSVHHNDIPQHIETVEAGSSPQHFQLLPPVRPNGFLSQVHRHRSNTDTSAQPFHQPFSRPPPLSNVSEEIEPPPALANFRHKAAASTRKDRSASLDELNSSTSSLFNDRQNPVSFTKSVRVSYTADGQKCLNEYLIVKKIGQGAYGKVKLVMDKQTQQQYAMKICEKSLFTRMKRDKLGRPIKSSEVNDLLKEVAILKKIEHPNVVKLYEVIDDEKCEKLYMIFEFVEGGAVMKLTTQDQADRAPFSEEVAKKYFRDLLMGLEYLHDHKIIHRDIKPENLLIDKNGKVKLTDFGVSIMFRGDDDSLKTSTGTPAFLPPEACRSGKYRGKPFDIWCSGVTLYVFLYGKVPFRGNGILGTYEAIMKDTPTFPDDINSDLKDLFDRVLEKNSSKRITLSELIAHRWVTDNGTNPISNEYSAQKVNESDIANAVVKGETLTLMDKFVIMSKLQKKFVRKINNTRERLRSQKVSTDEPNSSPENIENHQIEETKEIETAIVESVAV